MKTRFLFLFAFIIFSIAALFYYHEDKDNDKHYQLVGQIDFQADNIQALQTDNTGKVSFELQAEALKHYNHNNVMFLQQINAQWFPTPLKTVSLAADTAKLDQDSKQLWLDNHVIVTSTVPNHSPITLSLSQLQGDLVKKTLQSDRKVIIKDMQNTFSSQGFFANVADDDYQFSRIEAIYYP